MQQPGSQRYKLFLATATKTPSTLQQKLARRRSLPAWNFLPLLLQLSSCPLELPLSKLRSCLYSQLQLSSCHQHLLSRLWSIFSAPTRGPDSARALLARELCSHAFGVTLDQLKHNAMVFVNSACTTTLFRDQDLLVKVLKLDRPRCVQGFCGGFITASKIGNYLLLLPDKNGTCHMRLVKNCVCSLLSSANLLGTNQLTTAGVSIKHPMDVDGKRLPRVLTIKNTHGSKLPFPLQQYRRLWAVPSRAGCNGFIKVSSKDAPKFFKTFASTGPRGPAAHAFPY